MCQNLTSGRHELITRRRVWRRLAHPPNARGPGLNARLTRKLKLASLVQLDHVAIGIAHEDSLRAGSEANGSTTERDASRL
jgi:hypothetical protein